MAKIKWWSWGGSPKLGEMGDFGFYLMGFGVGLNFMMVDMLYHHKV